MTEHTIQKITYSQGGCLGECPIFEMVITPDRKVEYESIHFSGEPGDYKSVLSLISYHKILSLLSATDFPSLSNNYSIDCTCMPTSILRIRYDNGKVKSITDYGMVGTPELEKLYRYFERLVKMKKWDLAISAD